MLGLDLVLLAAANIGDQSLSLAKGVLYRADGLSTAISIDL